MKYRLRCHRSGPHSLLIYLEEEDTGNITSLPIYTCTRIVGRCFLIRVLLSGSIYVAVFFPCILFGAYDQARSTTCWKRPSAFVLPGVPRNPMTRAGMVLTMVAVISACVLVCRVTNGRRWGSWLGLCLWFHDLLGHYRLIVNGCWIFSFFCGRPRCGKDPMETSIRTQVFYRDVQLLISALSVRWYFKQ